jgi:CheY-like chemotaxis protein
MQEASRRGAALIRQLLAFSGPRQPQPRNIAPDEVVREWGELLPRIFGETPTVQVALGAGPAHVHVDPAHLEQVLVNLVANVRSIIPNARKLRIATRALSASLDVPLPPGNYVELSVSGSGSSSPTDEPRLFVPYFLVEGDAPQRGSSLANVQTIVEAWGGRILVDSETCEGTCVRIYIPALPQPVSAPVALRREAVVASRGATVLVVDDEPTLRSVIRRSLVREGFSVLLAEDGERALELANRHAGAIALLITDVVMPGMSGPELARRLRQQRPELGVLLISGYTFEESMPLPESARAMLYLSKPFDTKALCEKVQTLLEAVSGDQRAAVDRERAAGDPGAVVAGQKQG